ncbi:MAG: tRNA (adenosine(37)-N6)-dimethylallyltransferase MiaA [Gammaproteobacteria bacterium]|jgi:tRNA dimethylallyltransferase
MTARESNPRRAVFLMGPTASGKTELAMDLASRGPFRLVSVDSAMIYRGMDIGTAKPSAAERKRVPQRLIDIRDPSEAYSAADFRTDALVVGEEILAEGEVPLFVGGTMLYFRVLRDGIADMPSGEPEMRMQIKREARARGWSAIHERLRELDPDAAARIHPNDPQRLQRALEVALSTGKPISQWWRDHRQAGIEALLDCSLLQLVIAPNERAALHGRIEERFRRMLDRGLVEEVERLRSRGDLDPSLPAMKAVGYRQVWRYLEGEVDHDAMREEAVAATRQLAKRQLTWLRRWEGAYWLDSEHPALLERALKILGSVAIVARQPPTEA